MKKITKNGRHRTNDDRQITKNERQITKDGRQITIKFTFRSKYLQLFVCHFSEFLSFLSAIVRYLSFCSKKTEFLHKNKDFYESLDRDKPDIITEPHFKLLSILPRPEKVLVKENL